MRLAVDQASRAIAGFAVVVSVILDEGEDFEVNRSGEGNAMLGDVDFVFRGVELDLHDCIYDLIGEQSS